MAYHSEDRTTVLRELLALVQEKDSQGDIIAAEVLIWAFRRLVGDPTDPNKYPETKDNYGN